MSTERRFVVFDASVIVSALLFEHSTPGRALYSAINRGTIVLSAEVVEELRDVLARPKFDRYLTRDERDLFLIKLIDHALLIEVNEQVRSCRDPNDDKYLSLAISAGAMCIVTGDQDLRELHPFRGIAIRSPQEFLDSEKTER